MGKVPGTEEEIAVLPHLKIRPRRFFVADRYFAHSSGNGALEQTK